MRIAFLTPLLAIAALSLLPAGASAQNPWLQRRVLNIAHQGGEDEFPSNTLYAFKRAIRAGADMLELDVGVTSDGQVVVMHDTTAGPAPPTGAGRSRRTRSRRCEAPRRRRTGSPPGRATPTATTSKRSAYRFRGVATGKRTPPRGYSAGRLPRPHAPRRDAGVPAHADQRRDQGPHPETEDDRRSTCGTPRCSPSCCAARTAGHHRRLVPAAGGGPLPRARAGDGARAGDRRQRRPGCWAAARPGPAWWRSSCRSRMTRAGRRSSVTDGRERRPRAPRGLCLAHVAVRRRRVGCDLAAADRRVRRRGDDGAPGRVRADVARARRPRRLRLTPGARARTPFRAASG